MSGVTCLLSINTNNLSQRGQFRHIVWSSMSDFYKTKATGEVPFLEIQSIQGRLFMSNVDGISNYEAFQKDYDINNMVTTA